MGARHSLIKRKRVHFTIGYIRNDNAPYDIENKTCNSSVIDINRNNFWRAFRSDKKGTNEYRIKSKVFTVSIKDHKLKIGIFGVIKEKLEGKLYFNKTIRASDIVINFKSGDFYHIYREFSRTRNNTKRGKWKTFIHKNPFVSDKYNTTVLNDIEEEYPEIKPILNRYLGEGEDLRHRITDWFMNFHGIIKPDCHYELMKFYPGKKWVKKYPKLVEAILRAKKCYTTRLNALLQETTIIEAIQDTQPSYRSWTSWYTSMVPRYLKDRTHYYNKLERYVNNKFDLVENRIRREEEAESKVKQRKKLKHSISMFLMALQLLGKEAFMKLVHNSLLDKEEFDEMVSIPSSIFAKHYKHYGIKKPRLEKDDAFKLVNLLTLKVSKDEAFRHYDLADHFIDILELKQQTGKRWKFRAETIRSFQHEHAALSQVMRSLESEIANFEFDKKMIELIEQPIRGWIPYVLKSTGDYSDEGNYQNNCVYGYRKFHKDSFITSLRKENKRITCDCKYHGDVSQARARFNRIVEDQEAIVILRDRLKENAELLRPPDKKVIERNTDKIVNDAVAKLATA